VGCLCLASSSGMSYPDNRETSLCHDLILLRVDGCVSKCVRNFPCTWVTDFISKNHRKLNTFPVESPFYMNVT
jgi:hypothetical protein